MRLLLSITLILFILPSIALAQAMETFQEVPIWGTATDSVSIMDALYTAAIAIAAILVVFRLIWAGVQYMLSEVVTNKEKAKKDIQGALLGLLIILGAVTILNTINPRLTELNVIGTGAPVELSSPGSIDRVGMRVGDVQTEHSMREYCGSIIGGIDEGCANRYVDALNASCTRNGGQLVRGSGSVFTWINNYGNSTTYSCETPD